MSNEIIDILEQVWKNPFSRGLILWTIIFVISLSIKQFCYLILLNESVFKPLIDFLPILGFLVGLTAFLYSLGLLKKGDFPWLK